MGRSNFALRVPPALLAEARKTAESEGVALYQLITPALAENVSAMRTEEYFEEPAISFRFLPRGHVRSAPDHSIE
jgi:hypothetical protein